MESYSPELRGKVVVVCDAGESTHEVVMRFKLSQACTCRINQPRRQTGHLSQDNAAVAAPSTLRPKLVAKIVSRPDFYLCEVQAALQTERGRPGLSKSLQRRSGIERTRTDTLVASE